MAAEIPHQEVTRLLERAASGEIPIVLQGDLSWDDVDCGDLTFLIDGWRVCVFNDCGDLDYVSWVQAPDGRLAEFDDWPTEDQVNEPSRLMGNDSIGRWLNPVLEQKMRDAPPSNDMDYHLSIIYPKDKE